MPAKIKICTQCKAEKPLTDYRKDRSRLDGRNSHCNVCAREKQSIRYQEVYAASRSIRDKALRDANKQRIDEYKSSGCVLCHEDETSCLDFHHLDADKKEFGIGGNTHRTWSYIERELAKCVLVCKNCHTKIHAGLIELLLPISIGTASGTAG